MKKDLSQLTITQSQACGELCKNLPPQKQKEIIRELMIKEQKAIKQGPAGYEFSNKKRNPKNLRLENYSDSDGDVEFVNDANSGYLRQKKCILSSKWWR